MIALCRERSRRGAPRSAIVLTLFTLLGCSGGKPALAPMRNAASSASAGEPAPAADGVIEERPLCAPDNPFCSHDPIITGSSGAAGRGPIVSTSTDCGSLPIDLTPAGVNIMLAVDGAASMRAHWNDIFTAVRSLRANNPGAAFGVHVFWADAADPLDEAQFNQAWNNTNNACLAYHNKLLPLGDHTADDLVEFIGAGPQGGVITDAYQVGPVLQPLSDTYLSAATALSDPNKTNYLVLFSSANENCFGSAFSSVDDKRLAFQKLAIELSKQNIRVIPVGVDDPSVKPMNPWGGGPGLVGVSAGGLTTNYEALGTLLQFGGSKLKEVPHIDTPESLQKLISAGSDLERGASTWQSHTEHLAAQAQAERYVGDGGGRVTRRIFDLNKPVIAAINGAAVGVGITMTLAMDVRLCVPNAKLGFVFAGRGILPEACSSWFLPRLVGISKALEWCYTARVFRAEEGLEAGLIRSLHAPEELLPAARQLAQEIIDNASAVSVAMVRQMMWRMLGAAHPIDAHEVDTAGIAALGKSKDAREGISAFLEKRKPNFQDRVSSDMPAFVPWWQDRPFRKL